MKLIYVALAIFILHSCTPVKMVTVASDNVPIKDSKFVFENDTLKITYNFWANKGIMQFEIYNKLNEPIYFDWKNSAFIPNSQMVSYWQDVTNTEGSFSSISSYYYGVTSATAKSKSIHQERIGVIPPRSLITRKDYKIVKLYKELPEEGNYTKDNSTFNFRNYIMFSMNEKFEGSKSMIDNNFFIDNIKIIHKGKIDANKKQTNFYFIKDEYTNKY